MGSGRELSLANRTEAADDLVGAQGQRDVVQVRAPGRARQGDSDDLRRLPDAARIGVRILLENVEATVAFKSAKFTCPLGKEGCD